MKSSRIHRRIAALIGVFAVVGTTALVAAPAQAAEAPPEGYPLVRDVSGTATIAKRGMELNLPEGSKLYSKLDLTTFTLQSKLITPQSTVKLRIFDVPTLGDVTAKVKIQGTADSVTTLGENGTVSAVNKFKITIPHLASDLAPRLNLVKSTCASGEITANLTGAAENGNPLADPINISGTFDIPDFRGCGISLFGLPSARDALISSMLAGSGNTLSLTLTPAAG